MSKIGEAAYEAVLSRGDASPEAMETLVSTLLLGKSSSTSITDSDSSTTTTSDTEQDPKSNQILGNPFDSLARGEFVPPRYNPEVWAAAMEQSTRLGRSIRTYARNTVGLGWFIEPLHNPTPDTPEEKLLKIRAQTATLQKLFDKPNNLMPTTQLFYMSKVDEEATGDGYIEVVRNNSGEISKLFHAPAVSMRIRVKKEESGEQNIGGYVQIRGNEKRYFKEFGDTTVMDALTGEPYMGKDPLPVEKRATEILHFKLYSPTSSWYGAPRYVSAAPAVSGNRLASVRNVKFFENDAVPRMALLVSGGRLTPDSINSIEDFFKAKVQGTEKAHSVVVIQTEQTKVGFQQNQEGVKLDLKPLTVGVTEDASFGQYRQANDDEIREAFGIAPVFFSTENVNKACIVGSTKIPLGDGRVLTMKELVDTYGVSGESFPVYGFCANGGAVGFAKAHSPRATKTDKVFEIVNTDDEIILEATSDHEVMLNNEAYCFVADLREGDLLMRYSVRGGDIVRESPHKVKCVRFTGRTEEVYDLTSDVYHNFVIDSGMVIHNSAQTCVTGDTRIPLLDSSCPTIKDLYDKYKDNPNECFPVFSINDSGESVVGWGYNPILTKKARVFDVILDNGMAVRATGDHKFMLRSGEYREVRDLKPGMSLMPWYVGMPFNNNLSKDSAAYGYWQTYNPATDKYELTHNMVARSRGDAVGDGFVVHHKDKNPLNNHPDNLELMSVLTHSQLHRKEFEYFRGEDHPRYVDISFAEVCAAAKNCGGRNALLKVLAIGTSSLTRVLVQNGYTYEQFSKKFMLPKNGPPKGSYQWKFRKDATFENLCEKAKVCFYRRDLVKLTGYSPNLIYRLIKESGYSYTEFRKKFMSKERMSETVNHRVVAVRYAGEEDVYDITVHDYHNFSTAAGVVISNSREITNEQEFEPDRLEKEYIINQTIVPDILGEDPVVRFRFERMKLTDPLDTARMDQTYAGMGALTPNELRESLGKPRYPREYKFADKPMQVAMAELSMQLAEAIMGEFKSQIEHQKEVAAANQPPPMPGVGGGMPGMGGEVPPEEGGEAPPDEGQQEGEGAPVGGEGEGEAIDEWSHEASTEESSPVSDGLTEDTNIRNIHSALGLSKGLQTSNIPIETLLGMATSLMKEAREFSRNNNVSIKEDEE